MTSPRRRLIVALAGIGLATTLTACGSAVHGSAGPSEIDVRTLDIGSYPVDPLDIHDDDPPDLLDSLQIAGLRLSEFVTTAYDVDPRMRVGLTSQSFTSGLLPGSLGPGDAMTAVAKRDDMYFGFESAGSDQGNFLGSGDWPTPDKQNSTTIDLMVMQFADPATAARAAGDFYAADIGGNKANQPVPLGKYPDAHAHWRPGAPVMRSFLAHGSYVEAVVAFAPTADQANLSALSEKTYDTEGPVLDQLSPISDVDTLNLAWDPEYLLSRALNPDQDGNPTFGDQNAVFGPRGILHYLPDRADAKKTFTAIGGLKFARTGDALVVRTADAADAAKAVTDRLTPGPHHSNAEAVPKLPASACVDNSDGGDEWASSLGGQKRFTCIVAYRNYVGYVESNQLIDAHQRAAAQFALLANSQWEP
ncbi:hypothetical protein ABIA39_003700 [Nocardia sp. GAS34]|uniref:DUF7373 family lipoprotein n=1 Tax=unclassified Nocardia TaxID=2637762 RepID=UPI003D19809D